jgi:diguanylate cyclase (GGDEF)-like protein/PAS domain S-box-containing protein
VRSLVERLADPALLVDRDGKIQMINAAAGKLLGYAPGELVGESVEVLVPRRARARHAEHRHAFGLGPPVPRPMAPGPRLEAQHKSGAHIPVEISLSPLGPERGSEVLLLMRGIAHQLAIETRARLADAALAATATATLVTDALGRIVLANDAFTRLTGWQASEVMGENPRFLKSGVHGPHVFQEMWATLLDGRVWTGELTNVRRDGTRYVEANTISPIRNAAGTITHFVAFKEDVTARHQAEDDRERQIAKLRVLADLSALGARSTSVGSFALAAAAMLKDRLHFSFVTIDAPATALSGESVPGRLERLLSFGSTAVGRLIVRHGPDAPSEADEALLEAAVAQLGAAIHTLSLIDRLRARATTDTLTVLANRSALIDRGNAEVERAHRYGRPLSVVLLDIDHFKQMNDQHGHAFGDEVLRVIGAILLHQRRRSDLAARYGGDELVLLLPETDAEEAAALAERLRQAIARHGFSVKTAHVTASFGVAELLPEQTLADLLARADEVLYQAKREGRDRVVSVTLAQRAEGRGTQPPASPITSRPPDAS